MQSPPASDSASPDPLSSEAPSASPAPAHIEVENSSRRSRNSTPHVNLEVHGSPSLPNSTPATTPENTASRQSLPDRPRPSSGSKRRRRDGSEDAGSPDRRRRKHHRRDSLEDLRRQIEESNTREVQWRERVEKENRELIDSAVSRLEAVVTSAMEKHENTVDKAINALLQLINN